MNGHTKPINTESINGNGISSHEKREPIVMRIPKLHFLSNKVIIHYLFLYFSINLFISRLIYKINHHHYLLLNLLINQIQHLFS